MISFDLPPPAHWQDFENLCRDLWAVLWGDAGAQRVGRSGQAQEGLDILARRPDGSWAGVQCKRTGALTLAAIEPDIERARSADPPLSELVIATTAPRDAKLQQAVARKSTRKLRIIVQGWEDIRELLADHPRLRAKYYAPMVMAGLVDGVRRLPTDFAGRIENFIGEYLGSAHKAIPFGGRSGDLDDLDRWLSEPDARPYRFVTGPAGRGKSALLVRWLERLQYSRPDLAVVFLPVSIRFRTNLAGVAFPSLAAQLHALHGEELRTSPDDPPELWRGVALDMLRRPLDDGKTLLVVIDGLDEAADWEAAPDLFPLTPHPGLRVLVAARLQAGDTDGRQWLDRLGWRDTGLAECTRLPELDREGVAEALVSMGCPLDELGRDVDIVAELHRLSLGDPLLVRLYVDDLWRRGASADAPRLRPEDLQTIKPGLKGYFERWWADQKKLWEADPRKDRRTATTHALFGALACALGPLRFDDLDALFPDELARRDVAEALEPLARFVIGDGEEQGFVFSHPRLAFYFAEEYLKPRERQTFERKLLDWCGGTLAALKGGALRPEDASRYVVQHYGAHLAAAGAPPDDLLALVDDPWRRAWLALEGGYSGFLADADRAFYACEKADTEAAARGRRPAYLGKAVLCVLCNASVNSLAGNLSGQLLAALLKARLWFPAQSLSYARRMGDPAEQARALAAIAEHLRDDQLSEVHALARDISHPVERTRVLAVLAARLPGLRDEALAAIRRLYDVKDRLRVVEPLQPCLDKTEFAEIVGAIINRISNPEDVALLARFAPALPVGLMKRILERTTSFSNSLWKVQGIEALAPALPAQLIPDALAVAGDVGNEWCQARALAALAPRLKDETREWVLDRARGWSNPEARAILLAGMMPFRPALLSDALAAVRAVAPPDDRARVMALLLPHVPDDRLAEFLTLVEGLPQGWPRAAFAVALAQRHPRTMDGALTDILALDNDWDRAQALSTLMPLIPRHALSRVLRSIRSVRFDGRRVELLSALTPRLDAEHRAEAVALTGAIVDRRLRSSVLAGLVPMIDEAELREILAAQLAIQDEQQRLYVLALLGVAGSEENREKAFGLTAAIEDDDWRLDALSLFGDVMTGEQVRHFLRDLADHIEKKRRRGWDISSDLGLFRAVAPYVDATALDMAVGIARSFGNAIDRFQALFALARAFPDRVSEALAELRLVKDGRAKCSGVIAVVEQMPDKRDVAIDWVADEIRSARREWAKEGDSLARLLDAIPEASGKVIQAVREIDAPVLRLSLTSRLARHVPELVGDALVLLGGKGGWKGISSEVRQSVLYEMAGCIPEARRPMVRNLLVGTMKMSRQQAERMEDALFSTSKNLESGKALFRNAILNQPEHPAGGKEVLAIAEAYRELGAMRPKSREWVLRHIYDTVRGTPPLPGMIQELADRVGPAGVDDAFHAVEKAGEWWP